MPSLKSLAFALFAIAAPVLAGSLEAEPFGTSHLEARAPDAHHRHHHHHNHGAICHHDSQCRTHVAAAKAVCHHGKCGFQCHGNTVLSGNKCVPKRKSQKKCKFNASCPKTTVARAHSVCNDGYCDIQCNGGFHLSNGKCYANGKLCGGVGPPNVHNGYSICKGNKWYPQCNTYLGYWLHKVGGQYYCVNTKTSSTNCGSFGKSCKPGYNGLGHPVCNHGKCDLDCYGLKKHYLPNGHPYCAKH